MEPLNHALDEKPVDSMRIYDLGLADLRGADDVVNGHPGAIMGYECFLVHCPTKNDSVCVLIDLCPICSLQ